MTMFTLLSGVVGNMMYFDIATDEVQGSNPGATENLLTTMLFYMLIGGVELLVE